MKALRPILVRSLILSGLGLMTLGAHAQSTSVTQQFLGAPVPSPVVAVELDAGPARAMPQHPASAAAASGSSGQTGISYSASSADSYGSRMASQAAPAMYTGAGVAASAGGLAETIRAYESGRLSR
jgi:hypothetical protein